MIQEFISKLAKRERILVFASVAMIFLAFMDRAILGPILQQIKILDASIEAKTQMLKRNNRILSFSDSILKEYARNDKYLSSPDKNEQEMIASDLHAIETLAAQNTVTISNIKAGDITESPLSKELQINLDCEGTLAHTLQFMRALEDSNYLFRIKKYNLAPKSKTSELIKSNIEMIRIVIVKDEI